MKIVRSRHEGHLAFEDFFAVNEEIVGLYAPGDNRYYEIPLKNLGKTSQRQFKKYCAPVSNGSMVSLKVNFPVENDPFTLVPD